MNRIETGVGGGGDAAAKQILDLEKSLYRAMIDDDHRTLSEILSDDVRYIHSTGIVEGKASYLKGVLDGLYEYEDIQTYPDNVRLFEDGAVIFGRVVMIVGKRGQPKNTVNVLSTLIWEKENGAWRLLCRHATRLAG